LNVANALIRHAPPVGRSPVKSAPHGAIYVNATHFPLEWRRHVAWLDQRPDVRPVIWIHDLLAIERPGWFWGREPAQHQLRIKFLARRGAAAIVASASVEADLQRHLKRLGRHALPILRMTPPIQAVFAKATQSDPRLSEIAFFVVCGTIEPRKNHMLLLRVWRELIAIYGNAAPKLVVVGKRGWSSADIVAALEDQTLRGHVIEVAGLSTPDYKMLLDHCRALLAPSFAEGFGLPVAEALASGISVIASDIPPFREQVGESIRYLDPRSHESWRQAIIDFAFAPPRRADSSPVTGVEACRQTASLHTLDAFLRELPP
jgi:glycosyltransferase involved in cell wall biosynthesis